MSTFKHKAAISAIALVAVVVALFASPGSAAAGNLVANPGFESPCPGAGCIWATDYGLTIATVPSPHSGLLALGVSTPYALAVNSTAQCVGVVPGTYDFSYWYSKPVAGLHVQAGLNFFSGPTCGGSQLSTAGTFGATTSGAWAEAATQVTAPAATQSAALYFDVSCDPGCTPPTSALIDDVSLIAQTTTAATIRSFTASASPAGTLVRWRTASETDLAGFNVYRVEHGRKVKLNKHLMAAKGEGGRGASYRLLDRGHRGASYRLEVVNLDGTHQWRTVR